MDLKRLKKPAVIAGSVILTIYALFLIIPFAVSPLVNSYGHYLSKGIEETCGFKVKFENVRLITTPKLTAGVKAGHLSASTPDNDEFLSADNAQIKISLLPFLIRRVELDAISADNISAVLKVQKDGKFLIEKYFPQTNEDAEQTTAPLTGLPFGLKLSNHLPDIKVKGYKAALIDNAEGKEYSIHGQNINITDFILNKKIKVKADGKITLAGDEQFVYDIKLVNRLMPDLDLNELVFAGKNQQEAKKQPEFAINILDIFKAINKNQFSANIKTDLKTSGTIKKPHFEGLINIDRLTMAVDEEKLPAGHFMLDFKGKEILLNTELFTAADEKTTADGDFKTGRNAHANLSFKSNAEINNIFKILNSLAKSIGIKDFETLSAKGAFDANFTLNSDLKKLQSNGYFKIPSASIKYTLYNVLIDNICADVDFSNNGVDVKNAGFTILSHPLKLRGTIKPDTTTDIHLKADKLLLKGLIAATGQTGLLKDNNIKSGTLSATVLLNGTFKDLKPAVNLSVNNINIHNKPSAATVLLNSANLDIAQQNSDFSGIVNIDKLNIKHPLAAVSMPAAKVTLDTKDIKIEDTYLTFNNSRADISGKITDYTGKKPDINIRAKGSLLASDIKSLIPMPEIKTAGKLPFLALITGSQNTQNLDVQLLATPSNYISILDVEKLNGKSTLINSSIKIANNSLKLSDTGIFALNGSKTLSDTPKDNLTGRTAIITVKGSVDDIMSTPRLNGINIKSAEMLAAAIPGFKNSKLTTQFELTLNGNPAAPDMKGFANIPEISIPTIKTNLKNMSVDITNNAITIDTPTITIDNSIMDANTVVSTNFNNGVTVNSIDYNALLLDTDTLIKAMEGLPKQTPASSGNKSGSAATTNSGITINNGKGTVSKFKSGNLAATDLAGDFSLKNNVFYLKNLKGSAYNGKVSGDISVNIINGKTDVDFKGSGMHAATAIEGAAGLKNALSGTLGFNAKIGLNAFAPNQNDMMKSLTGIVDFNVADGEFGNIGRLENLLFAQNIISNGVMAALVAPVANMPVVKSAADFKTITGDMSFSNGWAEIKSIKTSGPSMAYYITGRYNLVNASANLTILGRLGADVVAALGPIGELSVSKLTSYIPKFGTLTGNLINAMTTNPNTEKTEEIPALSNGSVNYKDFKVSFNGGIESKSSVKSFKWLSVCDTSQIEGGSLKDQLEASKQNMQQLRKEQIEDVKQSVEEVKNTAKQTAEDLKNQIQNTKDSLNELKNLFKKPSETAVPAAETPASTEQPAAAN